MKKIRMQAHRGDSAYYPENTIPAFAAAVEQGYDVIEMDTKFTKDNVCVLLHDRTVNRTARNKDGSPIEKEIFIENITYAEACEYDYGIFMGEKFKGTSIPTLAEVLKFLKGKPVKIKLDNVYQDFNEERFEIFCQEIARANMEKQMAFTTKTLPYLIYLATKFPTAEIHYDGSLTPEALNVCKTLGLTRDVTIWIPYNNQTTAWFNGKHADAEFCREIHQYGKVGIWIISELFELAASIVELDADIIETDGRLKPSMLGDLSK